MPEKLNLAGIFSLMAEKVMDQVEKSVGWITTLITKGPIALIDMAKEFLGELPALFFDAFIGWLRNTIIVRAVEKLISMFNLVGAIIQACIFRSNWTDRSEATDLNF